MGLRQPRTACGRHHRHRNPIGVEMSPVGQVHVGPRHRHAMLPVVLAAIDGHMEAKAWQQPSTMSRCPDEQPASWT